MRVNDAATNAKVMMVYFCQALNAETPSLSAGSWCGAAMSMEALKTTTELIMRISEKVHNCPVKYSVLKTNISFMSSKLQRCH